MSKKKILISTSTYPRWKNDSVPAFVHHFAVNISASEYVDRIYVLAPHHENSKRRETFQNIFVQRFRYVYPYRFEDIAYEGGVNKIKKNPLYVVKLFSFITSQFISTLLLVKKNRINTINAHWLIPQGFTAIFCKYLTGARVVITVHGTDIFGLNSKLFRVLKKWILKHADEVVVNSSATLKAAKSIYETREYHVIPMGVDLDKFPSVEQKKPQEDEFTILFVGRLSEEKGVKYLLEAIKYIRVASPTLYGKLNLTIVGSGPEEARLKSYTEQENLMEKVKFKGWVAFESLSQHYKEADVFVGPSITTEKGVQEAFGLVFVESLAMNTPVIGTTSGGVKDIILDGKNGYTVPEKSAEELAKKIIKLYENPDLILKFGSNGREYVEKNFSWLKVCRLYGDVLIN